MKKLIIIVLVLTAIFVVAQRRTSSLHRIPSPTKIDGWLNVNGDIWPVIPSKWDLGKFENWYEYCYIDSGQFRNNLVWSSDSVDTTFLTPTLVQSRFGLFDTCSSAVFLGISTTFDTCFMNWLAARDSSSITATSPIVFDSSATFNDDVWHFNQKKSYFTDGTPGADTSSQGQTGTAYRFDSDNRYDFYQSGVYIASLGAVCRLYKPLTTDENIEIEGVDSIGFGIGLPDSGFTWHDNSYWYFDTDKAFRFTRGGVDLVVWQFNYAAFMQKIIAEDSIQTDFIRSDDSNYIALTNNFKALGDTNFIAFNSAGDDSAFSGYLGTSKFAIQGLWGVNNLSTNHEARFAASNNQYLRFRESGGNYFAEFIGMTHLLSKSDTNAVLGYDLNRWKEIWALRYMGTDPSKADSFGRYDDGDTNYIWSENPQKIDAPSVFLPTLYVSSETYLGDASTDKVKILGDSIIYITGACSTYWWQTADSSIIESNKPMRIGESSIIIANDCVTIGTELQVDGDLVWGSGGGLSFGEIYVQGNTTATGIGITNTWYQFAEFASNGQSNNCTPDYTSDHILITEAGIYQVLTSVSFTGGKDDQYELQIYKNDGATALPNLFATRYINNIGEYGSASMSGLANFAVNDSVELWVRNITNATDATLKDVNLSIVQIGK